MMPRNIMEYQQLLARGSWKYSFPEPSEGARPSWHLDFWLLPSKTVEEEIVVLSHTVCCTSWWQLQETHTASRGSIFTTNILAATIGSCMLQHCGGFNSSCWNVLWQGKNRVLSGYSGRAANSDLGGQGRLPGESDIWTETQKVIRGWPGEGKEAGVM